MAKIAVIGHGNIGRHIVRIAAKYGHEVVCVVTRSGIQDAQEDAVQSFQAFRGEDTIAECVAGYAKSQDVRAALLAIPSGGDGAIESAYIRALIRRGVKVVTAGKSALANRFDEIAPHLDELGFDATLGGGTMIPSFLRQYLFVDRDCPFVLTMVVNGTLNYAQTRVREGVGADQIVDEALRLGFAEPPSNGESLDALKLYKGELPDVARKLAICCNTCIRELTDRTVTQEDFKPTEFTEDDLAHVMSTSSTYVYLVRLCLRERDLEFFREVKLGGSIWAKIGAVYVAGGFVRREGSLSSWLPNHAGNAAHLVQGGDMNFTKGQGAGPVPTVGAMMINLRDLLKK